MPITISASITRTHPHSGTVIAAIHEERMTIDAKVGELSWIHVLERWIRINYPAVRVIDINLGRR